MDSAIIRPFRPADSGEIVNLFRATVREVNRRDYSADQVRAWAPDAIDTDAWAERLAASHCLVAERDRTILGFGNLIDRGVIDLLFVHKDHQGRGIANALLAALETEARSRGLARLVTEASLTARPFFERRGFHVIAAQDVAIRGQKLKNFRMRKTLAPEP
ncbi:MAG: GNAT family N-acetyltransferase [Pseudomonadota bacterium]